MDTLKSITRDPRVRQVAADIAVRIAQEVIRGLTPASSMAIRSVS